MHVADFAYQRWAAGLSTSLPSCSAGLTTSFQELAFLATSLPAASSQNDSLPRQNSLKHQRPAVPVALNIWEAPGWDCTTHQLVLQPPSLQQSQTGSDPTEGLLPNVGALRLKVLKA